MLTTTQCFEAELLFLKACEQIGFRVIYNDSERLEGDYLTIRKANLEEEAEKIDFFLYFQNELFPVQLTLISKVNGGKDKVHAIKKRLARAGKVALFWPVPLIGQQASFQFLQDAAEGEYHAKICFRSMLLEACDKLVKARTPEE